MQTQSSTISTTRLEKFTTEMEKRGLESSQLYGFISKSSNYMESESYGEYVTLRVHVAGWVEINGVAVTNPERWLSEMVAYGIQNVEVLEPVILATKTDRKLVWWVISVLRSTQGIWDRGEQLKWLSEKLGRPISSRKEVAWSDQKTINAAIARGRYGNSRSAA